MSDEVRQPRRGVLDGVLEHFSKKGEMTMTGDLIKEVKHIQQCLVNKDMEGEEWEEKMEMVHKLEDVVPYLKDAMGRGIEF